VHACGDAPAVIPDGYPTAGQVYVYVYVASKTGLDLQRGDHIRKLGREQARRDHAGREEAGREQVGRARIKIAYNYYAGM
jgi:hypothetical protein